MVRHCRLDAGNSVRQLKVGLAIAGILVIERWPQAALPNNTAPARSFRSKMKRAPRFLTRRGVDRLNCA